MELLTVLNGPAHVIWTKKILTLQKKLLWLERHVVFAFVDAANAQSKMHIKLNKSECFSERLGDY